MRFGTNKIITAFIVVFLLMPLVSLAASQEFFVKPGLLPDSSLYVLDVWSEELRYFFTFGKVNKAEYKIRVAEERLSELKALYEKGVSDYTEYLLNKYQEEILQAQELYAQVKLNSAEKVEELQNYTEDQILLNQSQVNSFLVQTVPDKYDNLVDSTVGGVVSGFQGLLNHLDEKNKQIQEKKKNLGVGE
jgi:hypothetical protein